MFDGARLASPAIGAACGVALGFGAKSGQRVQAIAILAILSDTFSVFAYAAFPSILEGAIFAASSAFLLCIFNTCIAFDVGIGLAFLGLAYAFITDGYLSKFEGIAVDGSGFIPIGAGLSAVHFASAFGCEMIAGNTGGDDACAFFADAGRGKVRRVAVHALRAAMLILIDAGIVIKAFVAGAFADNAFPILA